MTKPFIEFYDALTGNNERREMTDAEWESELERRASNEAILLEQKGKRQSAIDKLQVLGLSADDLKALGLG